MFSNLSGGTKGKSPDSNLEGTCGSKAMIEVDNGHLQTPTRPLRNSLYHPLIHIFASEKKYITTSWGGSEEGKVGI